MSQEKANQRGKRARRHRAKRFRASCERCRRWKRKCDLDGQKSTCTNCLNAGEICEYVNTDPTKYGRQARPFHILGLGRVRTRRRRRHDHPMCHLCRTRPRLNHSRENPCDKTQPCSACWKAGTTCEYDDTPFQNCYQCKQVRSSLPLPVQLWSSQDCVLSSAPSWFLKLREKRKNE